MFFNSLDSSAPLWQLPSRLQISLPGLFFGLLRKILPHSSSSLLLPKAFRWHNELKLLAK
jgi:hypothetical protein